MCVYYEKIGMKGKSAQFAFNEFAKLKKELLREQLIAKHNYEEKLYKIRRDLLKNRNNCENLQPPLPPFDPLDYLRREHFESEGSSGYLDKISWLAMAQSNEKIWSAVVKFRTSVGAIKKQGSSKQHKLFEQLQERTAFNEAASRARLISFGVEPLSCEVLYNLLTEAIKSLPSCSMVKLLLAKFLHLNDARLVRLDKETFMGQVTQLLMKNPADGTTQLRPNFAKDSLLEIMKALSVTSLVLACLAYPVMYQYLTKSDKPTELNEFSFVVLFHNADVINGIAFSLVGQFQDTIPIEFFLSHNLIKNYHIHLPYGERDGTDGMIMRHWLSYGIQMGRYFGLDRDIDAEFSAHPDDLRTSFKLLYFFTIISDAVESFEVGLPPLIKFHNIKHYDLPTPEAFNMALTYNRVLTKYFDISPSLSPQEFISFIEDDLIYELQANFHVEFDSVEAVLGAWVDFDVRQDSRSIVLFQLTSLKVALTIFFVGLVVTLYELALLKLRTFRTHFDPAVVGLMERRLDLLTCKYAFLLCKFVTKVLKGFQQLLTRPDIFTLYPGFAVFTFYLGVIAGLRRAGLVLGRNVAEKINMDIETFNTFITVDRFIKPFNDFNVKLASSADAADTDFFSLRDLSDSRIDRNPAELISKFEKTFANPKIICLETFKIVRDFTASLENDVVDLSFFKNNHVFYQTVIILSFLMELCLSDANPKPPAPPPQAQHHNPRPEDPIIQRNIYEQHQQHPMTSVHSLLNSSQQPPAPAAAPPQASYEPQPPQQPQPQQAENFDILFHDYSDFNFNMDRIMGNYPEIAQNEENYRQYFTNDPLRYGDESFFRKDDTSSFIDFWKVFIEKNFKNETN